MAGKNFLRIPDCVSFSLKDAVVIRDDYEGAFKPALPGQTHHTGLGTVAENQQQVPMVQGLQVRIAATHSGIITRNNGFYLPDKMKKGASSFTDSFNKPVLLHHEDHHDPIGRVILAQYMDTSGAIRDRYNGVIVKDKFGKEAGVLTDQLLADFVDGKMPFGAQVDIIRTLLKDSILEDMDYEGLGHIQIVTNITDQLAIQKLLDGRYLTGSVGATTDKAVCSICRQDWTETGACEHKPGGIYDGAKCFIIAGALAYDEYSFVNVPADRHSKVLQLNYNGVQDNVEILNDYSSRIPEVQLGFPQYDSVNKEEGRMKVKDAAGTPVANDINTETPATSPDPQVADEAAASTEGETVNAAETNVADEANQEGVVEDACGSGKKKVKNAAEEDAEIVTLLDAIESGLSDEDEEKLYDLLWQEAEGGFENGEFTLEELKKEALEDAKLSTEKRKSLSASTFCGPGRSFPVPDCAHVTAARRLIGRYKGPGDKSKILACVSRKAKALGCGSSKSSDSVQNAVQPAVEAQAVQDNAQQARYTLKQVVDLLGEASFPESDVLDDDEKKMLKNLVKKLAKLSTQDAAQALVEEGLVITKDCYQAVLDDVEHLETELGNVRDSLAKSQDHLNATRAEYTALYSDLETVQDELVKAKETGRKAKESHLKTLNHLKDKAVSDKNFTELTDEQLESEVVRLTDEVDMTQIVDKLGDGMSREPTENVESPVNIQDKNNQKSELSRQELASFEEQYLRMKFISDATAEQFRLNTIKRWKMEGKLPETKDE